MATPEIDLISQSDEAMEGLLCRVENTREKVIVYVNKDHYAIREALSAQPINRLMLNSLVTREKLKNWQTITCCASAFFRGP
jgi:hypothetical protein